MINLKKLGDDLDRRDEFMGKLHDQCIEYGFEIPDDTLGAILDVDMQKISAQMDGIEGYVKFLAATPPDDDKYQ
jgi:hypothetical protein